MNLSTFAIILAAFAVAPSGGPPQADAPQVFNAGDVAGALRASDIAEIYIVGRSAIFPGGPSPDVVRLLGCKYYLIRGSPAWSELESLIVEHDAAIAPSTRAGDVRVALILGDSTGIIWEMYADDPFPSQATLRGFSQGRRAEISAAFVRALEAFANRNREYGVADGQRRICS
ncbi:MAG TPA: hypothetical protein VGW40_02705 [Allosphingosinicella sp.]|nr:hypothetical protein [Allosphingosinicella sp.]